MVWLLVENVVNPVPDIVKVPLLVIPLRNSKVGLLVFVKVQEVPIVTSPMYVLLPVLLLSLIAAVPEDVVVEPAVKTDVLVFKLPLPVRVRAPERVTAPVVFPVTVPAMAVVPETANVLAPVKFSVNPEFTTRLWMETAVLMVTLVLMITSSDGPGAPAGDHVTVVQLPPVVDVLITPKAVLPVNNRILNISKI